MRYVNRSDVAKGKTKHVTAVREGTGHMKIPINHAPRILITHRAGRYASLFKPDQDVTGVYEVLVLVLVQ